MRRQLGLPPVEQAVGIAAHDFSVFTPRTNTEPQTFRQYVSAARLQGYWMTEAQLEPGLRGVSVPLRDRKGECKGATHQTLVFHHHFHGIGWHIRLWLERPPREAGRAER